MKLWGGTRTSCLFHRGRNLHFWLRCSVPRRLCDFISAARGLKQRVLLMTAYSAGLRVSELVNLKITDIDAAAHDASCQAR